MRSLLTELKAFLESAEGVSPEHAQHILTRFREMGFKVDHPSLAIIRLLALARVGHGWDPPLLPLAFCQQIWQEEINAGIVDYLSELPLERSEWLGDFLYASYNRDHTTIYASEGEVDLGN